MTATLDKTDADTDILSALDFEPTTACTMRTDDNGEPIPAHDATVYIRFSCCGRLSPTCDEHGAMMAELLAQAAMLGALGKILGEGDEMVVCTVCGGKNPLVSEIIPIKGSAE